MTTYESMPKSSKVWIYQSNLPFTDEEVPEIQTQIDNFVKNWVSHNQEMHSFGKLYHNRFIVLMVDDNVVSAGGCSIDTSVHFIKAMGVHHGVDFFNRMIFTYQKDGKIHAAHRDDFASLFQKGVINDNTLVFDNLVKTKEDFENKWVLPLKDSWHARMV